MTKMTLEQLKAKGYLVTRVEGLGECILVPEEEFDPNWKVYFSDEGYVCKADVVDGRPVTFVVLWKKHALGTGEALLPVEATS